MPVHRLRLREVSTRREAADFEVDAPDRAAAARLLYAAYRSARARGSPVVSLGGDASAARLLEPEGEPTLRVSLHALDEGGDELGDLPLPNGGE